MKCWQTKKVLANLINLLANRQRGTLAIEIWRKHFSETKTKRYNSCCVSQQQIKSYPYRYDGQCFANQLTDFKKMISSTLQHNAGPKAHYFNDKQLRNSRLSNANTIEHHWQLTDHVTEGGWLYSLFAMHCGNGTWNLLWVLWSKMYLLELYLGTKETFIVQRSRSTPQSMVCTMLGNALDQ